MSRETLHQEIISLRTRIDAQLDLFKIRDNVYKDRVEAGEEDLPQFNMVSEENCQKALKEKELLKKEIDTLFKKVSHEKATTKEVNRFESIDIAENLEYISKGVKDIEKYAERLLDQYAARAREEWRSKALNTIQKMPGKVATKIDETLTEVGLRTGATKGWMNLCNACTGLQIAISNTFLGKKFLAAKDTIMACWKASNILGRNEVMNSIEKGAKQERDLAMEGRFPKEKTLAQSSQQEQRDEEMLDFSRSTSLGSFESVQLSQAATDIQKHGEPRFFSRVAQEGFINTIVDKVLEWAVRRAKSKVHNAEIALDKAGKKLDDSRYVRNVEKQYDNAIKTGKNEIKEKYKESIRAERERAKEEYADRPQLKKPI